MQCGGQAWDDLEGSDGDEAAGLEREWGARRE